MKYGYILHTLLIALFSTSLLAQTSCPAPAPTQINVVSQSHTEIELDWPSVAGAQAYQLRTIDATTGTQINLDTVQTEGYIQEGLLPGQEYIFELSSSYCIEGPFGDPITMRSPTNIIVVDIIFQMECLDPVDTGSNEEVEAGDISQIPINTNPDGCFIITVPDPNNEGDPMSLLISTSSDNSIFVGNFNDNADRILLNGNGPLNGSITHPRTRTEIELFSIQMIKDRGGVNVEIAWEIDTDINILYCSDCSWSDDFQVVPLITSTSNSTPTIYPNPANNLFTIEMSNQDATVEVFDLNGRKWFAQNFTAFESLQLNVSTWPSGTYIVRTKSDQQAPLLQHFLKQH